MAKVTKIRLTPPPPPVPEFEYHLVLSEKEATALGVVLARVGGPPETSGRKYIDSILFELDRAGINRHRDHRFFETPHGLYWREGAFP